MNRSLLVILIVFASLSTIAQKKTEDKKEETWKKEKDYLQYQKAKDYKGPDDWYSGNPSVLQEEDPVNSGGINQGTQGIQYNPQRILRDRQQQGGRHSRGFGNGTLEKDPEVKRPDPIELPEVDPPDIDAPDLPDVDAPTIPPAVWQFLLYLILFVALIWIIYLFIKNRQPSNKRVLVDLENDWNPEVITKTELELRLESALANGDYREGVRIYFTFILKELIKKNWIFWKKDKTNHHYVLEMSTKPNQDIFRECVRIYDLVWYGEYLIGQKEFDSLQPTLLNYYKSLEPKDE